MTGIKNEQLSEDFKDLPSVFADPSKRDRLLYLALRAVGDEIYFKLQRGRFTLTAHEWRERKGPRQFSEN
jgi:hypothetical protein